MTSISILSIYLLFNAFNLSFPASVPNSQTIKINESNIKAGLLENQVVIYIPIENVLPNTVIANISLQIIDLLDSVIGKSEGTAVIRKNINSYDFLISGKFQQQDIMTNRLHYHITTKSEDVEGYISLSEILQQMETQLIGPREFYASSAVNYRIIARNLKTKEPLKDVIITCFLIQDSDTTWICDGLTDEYGNAQLSFVAPDTECSYILHIKALAAFSVDEITERITIKSGSQIYLVTDKPIYQPNQTIYLRALALSRFHLKPIVNKDAKIQIYDARNNRVYKFITKTDSFGVFSTDFQLADEINYGNYKIEAVVGNEVQSKTVEVKPYVLPKFKVNFTTDNEYYKPGTKVRGKLDAEYFFGKIVANARVAIKALKYDAEWSQFTTIDGKTGKNGEFEFSLNLPTYFVGQPFEQGKARVRFDVSVTDNANHEELTSKSVVVTKDDIVITIIPESNQFLAGIENTVFIITTYPDGSPAKTELNIFSKKGKVDRSSFFSDKLGLTEIKVIPDKNNRIELSIEAFDITGNKASIDFNTTALNKLENYLKITMDHSIYKTGDMAQMAILSTVKKGPVFIDVIKQGQTIGSETKDLNRGKAKLEISLSPEYNGLLYICAYVVLPSGQIIRDIKSVFVDPVSDLIISAEPDEESYLPGAEAVVKFSVIDMGKNPVVTSLGISIVDEAVFALTEMQPGLEKVYFMLEKEILTPRYEIHGFQAVDLVKFKSEDYNYNTEDIESRERAGKILFSQVTQRLTNQIWRNTGSSKTSNAYNILRKARNRVYADAVNIGQLLLTYPWNKDRTIKKKDFEKALKTVDPSKFHDPWGNRYEIVYEKQKDEWYIALKSAGPDEKTGTGDDLNSGLVPCITKVQIDYGQFGEIVVEVYNDVPSKYGKITGLVIDAETKEPLIGADAIVKGTELGVSTDERGQFAILNVPPGHYDIVCNYLGYNALTIQGIPVLAGKRTELKSRLKPTTIEVERVTVVAERSPVVVSQTQTSQIVTGEDLSRLPITTVTQVITLQAGVSQTMTEEPRVRKYFPETFLFEPSLITDENGEANLSFLLPDNITTWRMSMMGSAKDGRMGSNTNPLLVFKDFFIDLDLPVSLTCNDEISLPVAIYNYLKEAMKIRIEITEDDWFELLDDSVKEIEIDKENVGVVYFRIRAMEFGDHKILVKGYTKGSSDAIQKKVKVVPDGKHENTVIGGRLEEDIQHIVSFPAGTIPETQKLLVRLYPGILSQLVDGLEGLLKMPFGCFEQTTSITYPNILILNYLRQSDKRKPEIEMKALEYISIGYQRLLSYETPTNGFSWWGDAPGNKLLTAYGLMEFHDMQEVFDIDEKIIERTTKWFLKQQENAGSWSLDPSYCHMEVWGKFKNAEILPTAFITWALLEAGYKGKEIDRAMDYLQRHYADVDDPYALALVTNALVLHDPTDINLDLVLSKLISQKIEDGDKIHWSSSISSMTNSRGSGADIETSSLITLALIRANRYPDVAAKAINFLNASKSPNGGWCTTQGTVFALKALLASAKMLTEKTTATVNIVLNGEKITDIDITPEQSDVVRMIEIKDNVDLSNNALRLEFRGEGSLLYDVISDYYLSWDEVLVPAKPILTIEQDYDKTTLSKDDIITSQVKAANKSDMNLQMVIVDLGIPPGFDVIESDLIDLVAKKVFQKYNLTPRQIIIYFDNIQATREIEFAYHLKAKFPLKAKSSYSRIYDYYNQDKMGLAKPVEFKVK